MKKILEVFICTLLISTVALPVMGNLDSRDVDFSDNIARPIHLDSIHPPKMVERNVLPVKSKPIFGSLNIPVADSPEDELHPMVAIDRSGLLFGGYTKYVSILESDIYYTISDDGGDTWEGINIKDIWSVEGVLDFAALDYWGSGNTFVGTFRPSPDDNDGATQYVMRAEDPSDTETWSLTYYAWTSFMHRDKESPDIAGYSDVGDSTWVYGIQVDTMSTDYDDGEYLPGERIPNLYFPNYNDENAGWSWWWFGYEDAANACVDIDRSNAMIYAAWDQFNETRGDRDILYCIADYNDWWEENWEINWFYHGGSEENTFPDVAADNDYVYMVAQSDEAGTQDIVCYYSSNNGETWSSSIVAANNGNDETYPSIVANGMEAKCIFTMNSDLYSCETNDGGVTWSSPERINDQSSSVSEEYRTAEITTNGHTIWTDNRNGNKDIYYKSGEAAPAINLASISGGFGVSVVVENTGTASASNVEWSITLEGGLVLVGKSAEGTISSIPAGGSVTVKIPFVLGFGGVTITATADGLSKTASGTVLLFLVTGVS